MAMLQRLAWLPVLLALLGGVTASAQTFADEQAIIQFQRAADSYAFSHRQIERRGAAQVGMREGALFTPMVAAVFRSRIQAARSGGCAVPDSGVDFVVPRAGASVGSTTLVPPCIIAALPKLPDELEYRRSGIALLLADAHLQIVVDVLHAAFPQAAP